MLRFAPDSSLRISPELTVEELVAQAFNCLAPRVTARLHKQRQELHRQTRVTTEDEFWCIGYYALLEVGQRLTTEDQPAMAPELAALESRAIEQDVLPFKYRIPELPRR